MSPTTGNPATPFQGIAHPFNSGAQSVTFGINWSWDGGLTFPDGSESVSFVGNASGQWPTAHGTTMSPAQELVIAWDSKAAGIPPWDPSSGQSPDPRGFPTSYVAFVKTVGGPINSALTVVETSTP